MLTCQLTPTDHVVKVTFALPVADLDRHVSVVGDFNDWDPLAHPMKKRSNGTRSVSVEVPRGAEYRFKYLGAGGEWFCETATDVEPNEWGVPNSVLRV